MVGVTPEVQERLERYRPRKDRAQGWEQLRPLVLELAELSNPPSAKNASATLSAITAYVLWAKGKGIPLEVANLANYQVIDWFLAEQHYIESTEETYRSALYRMVDAPRPSDPKGRRRPPLRPYTADEQAQMVALVDKQPTERSSLRLAALLHAGLGAGLNAVELRHLRPEDVSRRDGAVVVRAGSGDDRRDVPVLASHAEPLWNVACRARQLDWPYLVTGNGSPETRNVISDLVADVNGSSQAPRIVASRLRTTWLVTHLRAATPLKVLLAAAKVSGDFLTALTEFVEPYDDKTAASLLVNADSRSGGGR